MVKANEKVEQYIKRVAEQTGTVIDIPEVPTEDLPINFYLIGQPQQNLFGMVRTIFGVSELPDRPLMRGFECVIRYGEENTAVVNGENASIDEIVDQLAKFEMASKSISFELRIADEKLRNNVINVIASTEDFEDVDTEKIKTEADNCLFVLSATALLSLPERKFLRDHLLPEMNDSLEIILTNYNFILPDDRPDIESSLNNFFGDKTEIFKLEDEKLTSLPDELSGKLPAIRQARRSRTEKFLLQEALNDVELHEQVLSGDTAKIDEAIEIMSEKAKSLSGRHESACRKMRMAFTSPIQVKAAEHLSGFYKDILDKLHSEINESKDISAVQTLLPDYIANQWEKESERIADMITNMDKSIQEELRAFILKDINDYLSADVDPDMVKYILCITDMYAGDDFVADGSFHAENTGSSKIKRYGVIATGVALVLLSHPIIGTAVAIYGSRAVKKIDIKKAISANVNAADDMCREIYDDMNTWLEKMIKDIEKNMADCVEECYQKLIAAMIKALNSKKKDLDEHTEQLKKLAELKADIMAELN